MGRSPCCSKEGLNRGAWTASEDKILRDYINVYGEGRWRNLPKRAGLMRCGKSCRLRWLNYLRPDIKRGNISPDEEELIIRLHKLLGNRWSLIAGRLPGRTDNEIKNYWNTNLGRKINNNKRKSSLSSKEEEEEDHPRPQNESHAIRTRAVRCSKVFFTIPQPHKTRPSIVGNIKAAGSKQRDQADDEVDPTNSMVKPSLLMESIPYNGILEEDDLVPVDQDFLGNVHGCWEDLLINSDFMGLCDDDQVFNGRNNEGNDRLPPSSDGSLIFSKDHIHVLGDWIGLP